MKRVYHMDINNANKHEKNEINMNKPKREDWITSIENAAEEAAAIAGWKTVDFILAGVGAKNIDDIPDSKLEDVYNNLQLIAEGDIY